MTVIFPLYSQHKEESDPIPQIIIESKKETKDPTLPAKQEQNPTHLAQPLRRKPHHESSLQLQSIITSSKSWISCQKQIQLPDR